MSCPCGCLERRPTRAHRQSMRRLFSRPTSALMPPPMTGPLTVLDTGMGRELAARCPGVVWSPTSLREYADIVKGIHNDNVAAGAEVITTFNYVITPIWLDAKEVDQNELEPLVKLAVKICCEVRDEWAEKGRTVRVAGCLPPLGPSYDASHIYSHEEAVSIYSRLATCMVGSPENSVDMFLMETIPSIAAAKSATEACIRTAPKVERWLSFTLGDDEPAILSGETVEEAAEIFGQAPFKVDAFLFNCCPVELCGAALDKLIACRFPGQIGAYPNSFSDKRHSYGPNSQKIHKVREGTEELTPAKFASWMFEYYTKGARLLGGCCGSGPQHIGAMDAVLPRVHVQATLSAL